MSKRETLNEYIYNNYGKNEYAGLIIPLLIELDWGKKERILRRALPLQGTKFDLSTFLNLFDKLNYEVTFQKGNLDNIDVDKVPFVFFPDHENGFVVTGINNGAYEIIDQENNHKIYKDHNVSGTAYFFKEGENKARENWFANKVFKFRKIIYNLLFISLLINAFNLSVSIFVMMIYDRVITAKSYDTLVEFLIGILFVTIASFYLRRIRHEMVTYIGCRIDRVLGDMLLHQIMYLPVSYTEGSTIGSQMSVMNEFNNMKAFLLSEQFIALLDLPFVVLSFGLIIYLIGSLAVVPLMLMLLYISSYYIITPFVRKYIRSSMQFNRDRMEFELEMVSKYREIKLHGLTETWKERHKSLSEDSSALELKANSLNAIINSISEGIFALGGLLIICFGAFKVIDGELTPGALVATMMVIWRTLGPFKALVAVIPKIQQMKYQINQTKHLLGLETEESPYLFTPSHLENDLPLSNEMPETIDIVNLSYRYPNAQTPTLNDVSFSLEPGQFTCIVGNDGSGKVTIMKLLLKLYEIQSGDIFIGQRNLKQLKYYDVRDYFAYLPDNPELMPGNIEEILLHFNPLASKDDIFKVTYLLDIYKDIVKLQDKFQTNISFASGSTLSHWFQFRLYLAGLLLRKPKVLLIDEPLEPLYDIEYTHLTDILDAMKQRMTILVATQDPVFLARADKIIYIKHGQVVTQGKPIEVLPKLSFDFL